MPQKRRPATYAPKPPPPYAPGRGFIQRAADNAGGAADYDDAERAFLVAMDVYKRRHRVKFPALTDVLAVLRSLGWRPPPADPRPAAPAGGPNAAPDGHREGAAGSGDPGRD